MSINYTAEQTTYVIDEYLRNKDDDEVIKRLAQELNKSEKSIIGKLSKENVYEKRVYRSKSGELPVTKKELVANLSSLISADPERLQGLEKAPKLELKYLIQQLEDTLRETSTCDGQVL